MKITKIFCTFLALILVFSLTACNNSSSSDNSSSKTGTGSKIDNDDLIQYDIVPDKPEKVVSAANDYKPESGYEYKKENNIINTDENVTAEGFTLTTTDEKTEKPKDIVYVYYEQGDINALEIDVLTKDATDADLDAAVKLIKELISSCFTNFPIDTIKNDLPLSTASLKALRSNNASVSEIVYGADTNNVSISYEYFPRSSTLIFRIES